jgi:hypothetical protein
VESKSNLTLATLSENVKANRSVLPVRGNRV